MLNAHLEKLVGFQAVAREGSFLRAAQVVGLSQPALSKSIKSLEDVIGSPLFKRHQRGVLLTDSGRVLLQFCEKLFSDLPDLEKRLKTPLGMSGVLKIGTYESLGISFWPKALKKARKELPHLQLRISTNDSGDLWKRLDEGLLDLIVDAEPVMNERYFSKVLYTDQFGVFASPDFQAPEDLLPMTYVQKARDRQGHSIEDILQKNEIKHELIYDFDTFVSAQAVALEGLAVAVLPLALATPEVRKKKLRSYTFKGRPLLFGDHRICATCLEERRHDPRLIATLKLLKDAVS